MNFMKCLRTPIFTEHLWWLPLIFHTWSLTRFILVPSFISMLSRILLHYEIKLSAKAAVCICSTTWVFLKIVQHLQEKICAGVSL